MTFTEEELLVWTVDKLKNYLTTRGVTVSGGGGRKADLIRKFLLLICSSCLFYHRWRPKKKK